MIEREVLEAIDRLSRDIGITPPRLVWSTARKGRYVGRLREIRIGPKCWRGIELALVHEFAHAVAHHRAMPGGHGPVFFDVLVEVCRAWYGDVRWYPWETEYVTLHRLAKAAGFSTTASYRDERIARWAAGPRFDPGDVVSFTTKEGRVMRGRVLTAYRGCRVKVRSENGLVCYVPPTKLLSTR